MFGISNRRAFLSTSAATVGFGLANQPIADGTALNEMRKKSLVKRGNVAPEPQLPSGNEFPSPSPLTSSSHSQRLSEASGADKKNLRDFQP